jgi:lipoprotein-anchoring transpeptidase ErfK/SrfK
MPYDVVMNQKWIAGIGVALLVSAAFAAQFNGKAGSKFVKELDPMPAVTFADKTGVTYISARQVAQLFNHHVEYDRTAKTLTLGKNQFACDKTLFNGSTLSPLRKLIDCGATLDTETEPGKVFVTTTEGQFEVVPGQKMIDIDQSKQLLVGYQGDLEVIKTKVSTGRAGHRTPNGSFKTGPYKSKIHYSKLYDNAPMPYSIQVNGNVFLHGYSSVPSYPASHGCIRVPNGRYSAARYLYNWAEKGVDVNVHGSWTPKKRR